MITFEVSRNGRELCTAGVPGDGILSAILSSVPKDQSTGPLTLEIGGVTGNGRDEPYCHMNWCREALEVGDEIVIRITKSGQPDEPIEVHKDPAEEILLEGKKMTARKLCEQLGWKIVETTD